MSTVNNVVATENYQAAGLFDTVNSLISNTQATVGSLLVLMGMLIFIIVAWRTKTLPGIIGGLVAGGIVAGAGAIVIAFSGIFTQTIQETTTASAEVSTFSIQHQAANEVV